MPTSVLTPLRRPLGDLILPVTLCCEEDTASKHHGKRSSCGQEPAFVPGEVNALPLGEGSKFAKKVPISPLANSINIIHQSWAP